MLITKNKDWAQASRTALQKSLKQVLIALALMLTSLVAHATGSLTIFYPSQYVLGAGSTLKLNAIIIGRSPTGTVTFKDGNIVLGVAGVTGAGFIRGASLDVQLPTVGSHGLTATYSGDTDDVSSTSWPISVLVTKVWTTTQLSTNSNNVGIGQPLVLTATVKGYTPTGTVTFKDGSTILGTATLTGTGETRTATLTTKLEVLGSRIISAEYAGDDNDKNSNAPLNIVTVGKSPSTASLSSSLTSAVVGQPVVLTATVAGYTPTGTVTFKDGSAVLGTATLTGTGATATATLTTTFNSVGTRALTVSYSGDNNDNSSNSAITNINIGSTANSSTTVTANPSTATVAQNITLTATVTGLSPTGTITFKDGAVTIGTANLSGSGNTATASLVTSFSTSGVRNITAVYAGDADDATSTSAIFSVTINNQAPSVSITAPANNTTYTTPATFTITANATDSDGTVSKVAFYNGSELLGEVNNAPYTITLNGINAVGTVSITAIATDNNNTSTTSAPISVTLKAPNQAPSVSITAPANNSTYTAPATLTITANATDSDGTVSKVAFYNGSELLGEVVNAPYSITLNNLETIGNFTLTAIATDNESLSTTSAPIYISIASGEAKTYYIHTDQLNTPRLITDGDNQAVWQWQDNDPFGNNAVNDDPNNTGKHFTFNHRLPGQYYDKETNTHYNYFRDYDPATGRYIESDPIGLEGGINTYAYVEGNPLSYVDPTGESPLNAAGGLIGAVSGGISGYISSGGSAQAALKGAFIGGAIGLINPFGVFASGAFGNLAGQASANYETYRPLSNIDPYQVVISGVAASAGGGLTRYLIDPRRSAFTYNVSQRMGRSPLAEGVGASITDGLVGGATESLYPTSVNKWDCQK